MFSKSSKCYTLDQDHQKVDVPLKVAFRLLFIYVEGLKTFATNDDHPAVKLSILKATTNLI